MNEIAGVSPWVLLFGNCCIMPGIAMFIGLAWGKGWLRSPIVIDKPGKTDSPGKDPDDPFS